jgi:hypothetical protein
MNKIQSILERKETDVMKFRPSNDFYKKIGINKKRFWQLVRNEKSATLDEAKSIATYFKVPVTDLIE